MKDTVHVPTLVNWLKDLTATKSPTRFQLVEAWQVAQTLHGIRYPLDQENLDNVRRDIVRYLANTDNQWNQPSDGFDPHRHVLSPSHKKLTSWTEVELTPELSWSTDLAGRTVPNKLVKALRTALGRQHANLRLLLSRGLDSEND
jgi:hypothetical protein